MIIKPVPPSILDLFNIYGSGSIIPNIIFNITFAAIMAFIAAILNDDRIFYNNPEDGSYAFAPFSSLGIAISLYLGFRNNAAFARWWEARQALGKQLVLVRSIVRTLCSLNLSKNIKERIMNLILAHVNALKSELRGDYNSIEDEIEDIQTTIININTNTNEIANENKKEVIYKETLQLLTPKDIKFLHTQCFVADALLRLVGNEIKYLYGNTNPRDPNDTTNSSSSSSSSSSKPLIDSVIFVELNQLITELAVCQGVCERIQKTPIPYAYNLLVHRATFLYVILLPFALAKDLHYFCILFNVLLAYTFFGVDEVSRQLENPFGTAPYSLPLCAMSRTIEMSVAQALERPIPQPFTPSHDGLLM